MRGVASPSDVGWLWLHVRDRSRLHRAHHWTSPGRQGGRTPARRGRPDGVGARRDRPELIEESGAARWALVSVPFGSPAPFIEWLQEGGSMVASRAESAARTVAAVDAIADIIVPRRSRRVVTRGVWEGSRSSRSSSTRSRGMSRSSSRDSSRGRSAVRQQHDCLATTSIYVRGTCRRSRTRRRGPGMLGSPRLSRVRHDRDRRSPGVVQPRAPGGRRRRLFS